MITMDKSYTTRGRNPVTLISINGRGDYPVIGYIGNSRALYKWNHDGTALRCPTLSSVDSSDDLIEVRSSITGYINIYRGPGFYRSGDILPTAILAVNATGAEIAIARIKITFKEGTFEN